ncbi:MAG TPA: carboxypeptidase regulatory-like domain-containing protein [Blastocatellia bacterium]|nr:carboxypeptidase regulatory-like domain-containing protein [Blastocatellia bacterium]
MFSKILRRVAGLSASLAILTTIAFAQTTQIEGTVRLKAEDGTMKPVPNVVVDIFRTDIKGKWDVKTDKDGHYVRLGMPVAGTFLVLISGPGLEPTWKTGVRLLTGEPVDFVVKPGDGVRLTLEQVQMLMNQQKGGAAPAQPTISAADKAKIEMSKKEYEAKKKEAEELQSNFDALRTRYNQGVELMKTNNYQAAMTEFEAAAGGDPGKHAAFSELTYRANANLAEAHYQIGVDLFNQKKRDEAKPHFEKALASVNKAITVATSSTEPATPTDLIVYYNILAKNAALLVEFYGVSNIVDDTLKTIAKAEAIDTANKGKWGVTKANMLRFSGRTDEAIAAYKAILAAEPNNIDAIYNMGLTLLGSTEKEKLQEAANALADFVSKAPAEDKRVPDARNSLEVLKNEFKVQAEKPSRRRGKP